MAGIEGGVIGGGVARTGGCIVGGDVARIGVCVVGWGVVGARGCDEGEDASFRRWGFFTGMKDSLRMVFCAITRVVCLSLPHAPAQLCTQWRPYHNKCSVSSF